MCRCDHQLLVGTLEQKLTKKSHNKDPGIRTCVQCMAVAVTRQVT